MSRLHVIIVILFAVAFGTGMVVGMGVARGPMAAEKQEPHPGGSLNLTAEQGAQMKAIWSPFDDVTRQNRDKVRPDYRSQRDKAAVALLTPEQKTGLDKINDLYASQIADLKKSEDVAFNAAMEKTKALLTPEQFAKFEDGVKRRFRGGPNGGHGPGTRPDGGHGPDGGHPGGPGGPGGEGPGGNGGGWGGGRDRDGGPWARPNSESTSQPAEVGK